jgi:hypothetical protein
VPLLPIIADEEGLSLQIPCAFLEDGSFVHLPSVLTDPAYLDFNAKLKSAHLIQDGKHRCVLFPPLTEYSYRVPVLPLRYLHKSTCLFL